MYLVSCRTVGYSTHPYLAYDFLVHIIFLHGFCSSASSFKAQLVKAYVENHPQHSLFLPDLSHHPEQAIEQVENHILMLGDKQWGLIGSSLGGFYATYLAEKHQKKAVLINPAVTPHVLLKPLLGENKNYHSNQTFELTQEHLHQFSVLRVEKLTQPQNLLLLTQTGDEVLDYKKGVEYYQDCPQIIIEGGDHGFGNYADYLQKTIQFLEG